VCSHLALGSRWKAEGWFESTYLFRLAWSQISQDVSVHIRSRTHDADVVPLDNRFGTETVAELSKAVRSDRGGDQGEPGRTIASRAGSC
jgi:hypothetical protein